MFFKLAENEQTLAVNGIATGVKLGKNTFRVQRLLETRTNEK